MMFSDGKYSLNKKNINYMAFKCNVSAVAKNFLTLYYWYFRQSSGQTNRNNCVFFV